MPTTPTDLHMLLGVAVAKKCRGLVATLQMERFWTYWSTVTSAPYPSRRNRVLLRMVAHF